MCDNDQADDQVNGFEMILISQCDIYESYSRVYLLCSDVHNVQVNQFEDNPTLILKLIGVEHKQYNEYESDEVLIADSHDIDQS